MCRLALLGIGVCRLEWQRVARRGRARPWYPSLGGLRTPPPKEKLKLKLHMHFVGQHVAHASIRRLWAAGQGAPVSWPGCTGQPWQPAACVLHHQYWCPYSALQLLLLMLVLLLRPLHPHLFLT